MGMIGEIKLWGRKEAPRGWRFCDGSEIDYFQAGALGYVIQDSYGWTPGTSKIHPLSLILQSKYFVGFHIRSTQPTNLTLLGYELSVK